MGSHILYYLPTHPIITLLLKKKNDFDSALSCCFYCITSRISIKLATLAKLHTSTALRNHTYILRAYTSVKVNTHFTKKVG